MANLPLLSLIILTPAVGGILLAFLNRRYKNEIRQGAFLISGVNLLLTLAILFQFDGSRHELQLVERYEWIPAHGIEYHIGIDGISILLVLLTSGLLPLILLSTWRAVDDRVKEFQIGMLFLQSAMLGIFLAVDLVLFYFFWEAMLIPMYLLIGVWGGERRIYAALKFFIYTMVGSLVMLLAILWLWNHTSTFNSMEIRQILLADQLPVATQCWLFAAFALSFAIKVPLFPFHTWLPDAHVEAPTAGSVVLAGVLLKMGTYGFLRFCIPLFPLAVEVFIPWMAGLAVVGIIFGALMAFVQSDIKKLVAYSSVSHLGFVVLGIFALTETAVCGSILQMVNHGLSTSMLFLLVGVIYERCHTREIANYGGIARVVPVFSVFFLLATLSSIGLPGLNGFVGEFLILLGSFQSAVLGDTGRYVFGTLATTGVVLGAVYMLTLAKRFLFGPIVHPENENIPDCTPREIIYLAPFVVMMVWIGLYPTPFLNLIQPTVEQLIAR